MPKPANMDIVYAESGLAFRRVRGNPDAWECFLPEALDWVQVTNNNRIFNNPVVKEGATPFHTTPAGWGQGKAARVACINKALELKVITPEQAAKALLATQPKKK